MLLSISFLSSSAFASPSKSLSTFGSFAVVFFGYTWISLFTLPSALNNGRARPNGTAAPPVIVCCFPSAPVIVLDFSLE